LSLYGPKGNGPKGNGPKGNGPKGNGPKGNGPKGIQESTNKNVILNTKSSN
jgi:hypothetical protein